jgi:succinoglycan biosynthesis protein ExoV
VAGSGYGGYSAPPDLRDGSWNILWLRGPLTAETLGVDRGLAICDAAILLRAIPLPEPAPSTGIAFMPHFESATRGDWAEVCAAGRDHLSRPARRYRRAPRGDPGRGGGAGRGDAWRDHRRCAAHALGAALPIHPSHRMKWTDWAASLDLTLTRTDMPPSNLREAYVARRVSTDRAGPPRGWPRRLRPDR